MTAVALALVAACRDVVSVPSASAVLDAESASGVGTLWATVNASESQVLASRRIPECDILRVTANVARILPESLPLNPIRRSKDERASPRCSASEGQFQ